MLNYRLPREPSTPRSAVWRKLRQLGVVQLSDGLVALPADARTREQLEWIAEHVREADGAATLWLARPVSGEQERAVAATMAAARADEYREIAREAAAAEVLSESERMRLVRRLRNDMHVVRRRDFFPPPERDLAIAAIDALIGNPAAKSSIGGVDAAGAHS
jgi:hypothetical protein